MSSILTMTGYAWIFFSVLMLLSWAILTRLNFWSAVDAVWAFGIGLAAVVASLLVGNFQWRSTLACILVLTWSGRLGRSLVRRLKTHYPQEDRRYIRLKETWTFRVRWKSFLYFQFQALTQIVLFYPILVLLMDSSPNVRATDFLGVGLIILGIVGEGIADAQLLDFKQRNDGAQSVCDVGLWRYSRHPNYFFEWIVWVGFFVLAVLSPGGGGAIFAPAIMYVLLVYVTGVAPSERESVRSRGSRYQDYQRRTNAFFPGPSKTERKAHAR